ELFSSAPHCSYTGAANVEPAPEIVAFAPLEAVLLDDFELPHAASTTASTAPAAMAPIFELVTASPLGGCRWTALQSGQRRLHRGVGRRVSSTAARVDVNIS